MSSILEDIKSQFRYGSVVNRLIIINLAVYLFLIILFIGFRIAVPGNYQSAFFNFFNWFAMPNDALQFIKQPWSLVTHFWLHHPTNFLHILFNMLWLYIFGEIFLILLKPKQLYSVYFLGGIAGAFFYVLCSYILPFMTPGGFAVGASACIMALVLATTVLNPDHEIRLIFLGNVKIKWIALFAVALDIMSLTGDSNLGGHIAHLGGALFGFIYMKQLQNGNDLGKPFYAIIENYKFPAPKKRNLKMVYKNEEKIKDLQKVGPNYKNKANKGEKYLSNQERIDAILDKITEKGYESLSKEEIDFLNNQQ